jgi:hypothetical protein
MSLAIIWLVVFFSLAVVFLIFLITLKYLNSKDRIKSLFGDSAPYYFKGVLKRLNPFLIVKKHGKEFHLKKQGEEELEDKLIILNEGKKKGTPLRKGSEGDKIQIKDPDKKVSEEKTEESQQNKEQTISQGAEDYSIQKDRKVTTTVFISL